MKIITHNITLDVASPHARGRMFEVKRKDGGTHTINFTLTENGTAISEYDGVTSYRIRVLHMDKSSTETEYTDFAGTIKHTLSAADLGVFGDALCEVSLYDDSGSRLTSAAFGFFIVPDINTDEGVLNDSNYPVLDNLIKTVNENLSGVESMTKKANDLITKAETVGSNASNLAEVLQTINNNVNAKANEVKSNSDRAETAADSANSAMSRAETAANSSETEASKAQSAKNNAVTAQEAAEFAQGKAETAADNAIAAKTAAEAAKTGVETYMESDKFHTHDNKAWLDKLVYLDAYPTYSTVDTVSVGNVDVSVFNKIDSNFIYTIDVKKDTIWEELKNYALNNSDFTPIGPISGEATMFRTDKNNTFCIFLQSFITYDSIDSVLKKHTIRAIQYFIEPSRKVYSRTITKTVIDETVSYTYADFKRIDGEDKVDKIEGKDLSTNDFTDAYKTSLDNLPTELDKKVDKTDYAGQNKAGLVKIAVDLSQTAIEMDESNYITIIPANPGEIMTRLTNKPITPQNINYAVKAALSDSQRISDMTVGEKANARDVIGAVGPTDYANADKGGVVRIRANADDTGLMINNYGILSIVAASEDDIDSRSTIRPITPDLLDYAVRSVRPNVIQNTNSEITLTCAVNTIYCLGGNENVTSIALTLPATGQYGDFIQVDFYSDASSPTNLTITSNAGFTDFTLIPEGDHIYSLFFDWGMAFGDSAWGWRFNYAEYPYVANS